MYKIAVLGAGYMGSAITYPITKNGHKVNLWGTWLDDKIIDSCQKGFHPKLKKALPDLVNLYYSKDLVKAVEDVDMIFIAVTSDGFLPVFKKLLDTIRKDYYFFKLTKGLVEFNGKLKRATEAAEELFSKKFPNRDFFWTTIGGPVKAVELSNKIPTASIYGINNNKLRGLPYCFATDYYPITISDDVIGVEVSSAFKNVYAIAIGICDGIYKPTGEGMYHNFNAFIFNQAMIEMAKIVEAAGGRNETAFDLAGIGDFYVASLSGRNRRYGDYIGGGSDPEKTYKKMHKEGEIAEGYQALKIGFKWVNDLRDNFIDELPLLNSLYNIVFNHCNPVEELKEFVQKMKKKFKQKY